MKSPENPGPRREEIGAFILTGGASRRMGKDKARLEIRGRALANLLAARLEPHVSGIWLVAKQVDDFDDLGLPIIADREPERALVHGIRAALEVSGPEWRWILACDMPLVQGRILDAQWRTAQQKGAPGCCAQLPGLQDPEPLPSLWHASLASQIRLDWGWTARDWVRRAGLAVWLVPTRLKDDLRNVNTPEDWALLESETRLWRQLESE